MADWDVVSQEPESSDGWDVKEQTPVEEPSWGASAKEAITNIPSSAVNFGKDMIQPILHPVDTAESLYGVGKGLLQKAGAVSGDDSVKYADALGQFFKDRYGSIEAAKHTLAHDPVGIAADLSTLLTGGSTLAARAPGLVGRAAGAVGSVGRAIDPLSAVGKAVQLGGHYGADLIGNLGTHTGGDAIRTAATAGREGGAAADAFRQNMRGTADMEEVVGDARRALGQIRKERGTEYRAGMSGVGKDATILDFDKIDNALAKISAVKVYKGQTLSPKTQGIRGEIGEAVRDWKMLDPTEFHTAEGMDALKQKIGDIRDATQRGTPENVVANEAYHAIRNTIIDQVPEYAKVMKGYEEASKQIKEIERTLSLDPRASVDTALRKLQSVLRNNVNTNYGYRKVLAEYLVNAKAPHLMEKLSGQMLSSPYPRGLGKLGMQLAGEMGIFGAAHAAAGASTAGLATAATLPFMSPRLVGEAAYYGGKASRLPIRPIAQSSFQIGRIPRP